jgi:carbamoyltransferase
VAVIGVNLGVTESGRRLRDGGACIATGSGAIIAVAEERLTRAKHDGGFYRSLRYCLDNAAIERHEIAMVTATSCCEPVRGRASLREIFSDFLRVNAVTHHLAHAYSAYWPSPYSEALVIVLDSGGNTIAGSVPPGHWWMEAREQATYYLGTGSSLTKLGSDFDRPYEAGFGEVFRAFTHYLGWPSSTYAGNTMALAALGDEPRDRLLFEVHAGRLVAPVRLKPSEPIATVVGLLQNRRLHVPPRRRQGTGFLQTHADLARVLQESFYQALRWRLETLIARFGVRDVCFAGGVALNCVAVGRLLDEGVVDSVFVQSAAGDTGQCLGAAYAGLAALGIARPTHDFFDPFLGRIYDDGQIDDAIDQVGDRATGLNVTFASSGKDMIGEVATRLARGEVIAWFSGRSEFGPRALGARSILADPRSLDVRKRLLHMKDKESFMPFAPSVLDDQAGDYFVGVGSRTMTVAVQATTLARQRVPAVVHADGTARVQMVAASDGAFRRLIEEFASITDVPMVLNTSLNLAGEPIVESPLDAIDILLRSDIDALYLDGNIIAKR